MASSIDATKPTAGAALTADVRNNFSAAKTEIEALQAAVASIAGSVIGARYQFVGTTTTPAAGQLAYNGGAERLYVNKTDAATIDQSSYLGLWFAVANSTSPATVVLASETNPSDVVVLSLFGSHTVIGNVHRYEATLLSGTFVASAYYRVVASLSGADGSVGPTGAVAKAGDTMTGALNWAATQTIASATTTDIGAATSNSVIVSGTTTITALGTIAAGAERVVQFSGALTLTHNATSLILPGGASITTAAGDVAYFVSLGTGNWRCTGYQKANGQAVVASGGTGDFKSDGTVAMTGAIQTTVGTMTSSVADGASAVAFSKNTVALANSAALIERWQNNSVTKAAIRYTGSLQLPAGSTSNVSIDFGNQNTGIYNETQNGVLGVSYANQCMFSAGAIGAFLIAANPFGWSSTTSASTNNPDTRLYRGAAGRVDVCSTNNSTYGDVKLRNLIATAQPNVMAAAAPTIASAATIAPTVGITFISGTTNIDTITAPSPISAGGGQITLIPTGLWATTLAGNIALATTAVVSKALILTYDTTTGKWYPSY